MKIWRQIQSDYTNHHQVWCTLSKSGKSSSTRTGSSSCNSSACDTYITFHDRNRMFIFPTYSGKCLQTGTPPLKSVSWTALTNTGASRVSKADLVSILCIEMENASILQLVMIDLVLITMELSEHLLQLWPIYGMDLHQRIIPKLVLLNWSSWCWI